MPLFRFHRGGLQESLDTTVIVKSNDELREIIKEAHKNWIPTNVESFSIICGPYWDENNNFDRRIGWYTHLVTTDIFERGVFHPEGYLSEPLDN